MVAGLEVLELGEEGPAGGPADDDLLLGEDVLLGEEVELLPGIAEAAGQGADEEGGFAAGRDGERRIGLEDGHVALAEERRQALARRGVRKVDEGEVALGLELLEVLEEERDLVVEARHGLEREREGAGLAAGRGAEILEPDGFLADPAQERRREDGVGLEAEDAVGEEVGELVVELADVVVPLAVDGLGIVDDEDGIAEVIGGRDEAVGEQERQGGEARAEFAAPEGGDLGVEVAPGALGPLPGGGRPEIEEFGRRGELAQAGDGQPLDPLERALVGDVELAQGDDPGAVELDAEGIRLPGREDVDDAAAPGVLAGRGDEVLAGVAVAAEGFEEGVVVGLPAHFEGQEQAGEVLGTGHGLEQAAEAGDDQGRGRGEQPAEEPHPGRRGVEGRRDLEVGIVGEGGEGGRAGLRREAREEEAAVPLEGGQRGGFGADEDDRPAGRFGQAGEKVGLGRFDDAVDGERPLRRGDGPDEFAELRRAKEEVEAHRAILTAGPDAVKPPKMGPGLRPRWDQVFAGSLESAVKRRPGPILTVPSRAVLIGTCPILLKWDTCPGMFRNLRYSRYEVSA